MAAGLFFEGAGVGVGLSLAVLLSVKTALLSALFGGLKSVSVGVVS